jgi:bacterioferritin-associated ferredoxin
MYICICKAVTDGQIREAISRGACTRKELAQCLKVGKDCGKCAAELSQLIAIHAPRQCSPQLSPAHAPCKPLAA